jgi:hypothetical protein
MAQVEHIMIYLRSTKSREEAKFHKALDSLD